jgi:hypothetical protein
MFRRFFEIDKPKLGRWSLKTCNELATSINSVYQNRDHCGDVICKTPKKASEYKDNPKNAPVHETTDSN